MTKKNVTRNHVNIHINSEGSDGFYIKFYKKTTSGYNESALIGVAMNKSYLYIARNLVFLKMIYVEILADFDVSMTSGSLEEIFQKCLFRK